jgi:hypothetical protein
MSEKDTLGFGSKPCMKEVPLGRHAVFTFRGEAEIVETEWGEKYSFPITLLSHPEYPLLEDGPIDLLWQSKCQSARQIYRSLFEHDTVENQLPAKDSEAFYKLLKKHYEKSQWRLDRFDNGAYWLEVN